ncbi:MAG: GNAT family N-acetyltransferase [Gemmatimonadetes bacterium]|nr:GNAT family N-acetyltransferase [Gemmatimonadota bacterium]MBT7860808.1 GNAT family N-acetyltransferase [Gemmatimonadota bacterium]
MTIRPRVAGDLAAVLRLWNDSAERGDVLLKPITAEAFAVTFEQNPSYDGAFDFVAEVNGHVVGWISGIAKKVFLPKETHQNTPGFLTVLFVDAGHRRQGIGTALLKTLKAAFRQDGKQRLACLPTNPIDLGWTIPDTPGHDHNNAPGVDLDGPLHPFLQSAGFADGAVEVAMYLDLSRYEWAPAVSQLQEKLLAEGIQTGRYNTSLNCNFDRMCDRVGSEYWRSVLQEETAKPDPRPILAAIHEGYIVGFTGPVDKEASGRGWFTGICTDPEFEQRGIATVLFNLLMQEFVEVGAQFSTLFTGDSNHAQRLYARTGFDVRRRFVMMQQELA